MSQEPREFWLLQEIGSNRALLRSPGTKYPDDVNGEPGPAWVRIVHGSIYDALKAELAQCRAERDALEAEYESWSCDKGLDGSCKVLEAKLAALTKDHAEFKKRVGGK